MKAVIAVCLGVTLLAPAAHSTGQDRGLPAGQSDEASQSRETGDGCGPYGACDGFIRIAQATPAKPTPHGVTGTDDWLNPGGTSGNGGKPAPKGTTGSDGWINTVGGAGSSGGKPAPKGTTGADGWINTDGGTGNNGGKPVHKGVTSTDDWENTSGTAESGLPTGKRMH